jgi:hypothetical protein
VNAPQKNLLTVVLAATGALSVCADQPKPAAPVKPAPAHSVFTMPSSMREGRDPFFPESPRPYEDAVAAKRPLEANTFLVKGRSFEHGHAMVIINNHTFAVGDEGDVLTTTGRVHIRLAEIHGDIAVIEVNGSHRELNIANK